MLRRAAFVSSILLLPFSLAAQRADTTLIPRELAVALLAFQGFGNQRPAITVGKTPTPGLDTLMPRGATILGGFTFSNEWMSRTRGAMTVASSSDRADTLLERTRALFYRAGWKPPPPAPYQAHGGFVEDWAGLANSASFCRDSLAVFVRAQAGDRGSLLGVTFQRTNENSICTPRELDQGPAQWSIQIPTFRPPDGSSIGRSGGGSSTNSRESYARLNSALTPAAVVTYFAGQLEAAGWTLLNRVGDGDIVMQTARRTDEKGRALFGALVDLRLDTKTHDVSFRAALLDLRD